MTDYTRSSGNVFKDLGLPSSDERLAKAKLAYKINRLIADQEMSQKKTANFLGISRSKVTELRNGRLKGFTIDDLFSLLEKLDPPSPTQRRINKSVKDHEAFGMWRDRKDMTDVDAYVRNSRKV